MAISLDETDFQNEKFYIEVSARYHDYRRSTLGLCVTWIRLLSLTGAIASLFAVSTWVESSGRAVMLVTVASIVIGIVNLLDLVFQVNSSARIHASLYQRFKALQEEIARKQREWQTLLPEWQAEAQSIRIDEPPTYWAIYTRAWNQTAEKYRKFDHKHNLNFYQKVFGNVMHFRPDEFGFAVGDGVS